MAYGMEDTADENYSSLDLGSESALEVASPVPQKDDVAPYMPGKTSEVGMQIEGTFMDKVASFLVGAGTRPGQISPNDRLYLAQQAALRDQARLSIAAAHQIDTRRTVTKSIEQADRTAIKDGHEFFQNTQARMQRMTPEERKVAAPIYKTMLGHFNPELADLPDLMAQDLGNVLGLGSLISDPELKDDMTRIASGRPYAEVLKDPIIQRRVRMHGRDVLGKIFTRIPNDDLMEIQKGKHDQGAFEKIFDKAMHDESLSGAKPIDYAFAKAALLESDYGEEMMLRLGVKTDKMNQFKEKKEKDGGFVGQLKTEDLKHNNEILEFDKTHPGMLPAQHVADARLRVDQHMSLAAKTSSPGQFSENNPLAPFLLSASKGKYKDPDTLLQGVQPGTSEYSNRLAMLDSAISKRASMAPQAMLDKQMGTPVDISKVDMYSRKDVRAGKLSKLSVPMSEFQKRTNPDMIELEPKFLGSLSKLQIAKEQGNTEMFGLAAKAFPAKTKLDLDMQWGKWKALDFGGPAAAFITNDPKNANLVAYHDTYTAWAGKDARALGDEVGTMTDADRLVWKDTFPKPTDTPVIQKQKQQIFNHMLDLIYDINARVATGDDPAVVLADKKIVDRKNGIFGSARQLSKADQPNEAKSLAEPSLEQQAQEAGDKRSPGEVLLEKMRKGK